MEKLDTTTSFNPEKQREVELFGSLFCPYTKQATRFLEEKGISYTYKEVPMIFGWKLPLKNYLGDETPFEWNENGTSNLHIG